MTMQTYRKLKAAENAVEQHMSDLESIGRSVLKEFQETRSKVERDRRGDMPDSVTEISHDVIKDSVTFSGYRYCRGCTDSECITMPAGLIFGDIEARQMIFAARRKQQEAETAIDAQVLEHNERAKLAALKEKYG